MTTPNPEERALDWLMVSLVRDAHPEDRERLAEAFGAADTIGRHLPAYAVPGAIRACWLSVVALQAELAGDPWAPVLREAATAVLLDAAGPMEPLVTRAPRDPRELTDGP